MTPVTTRVCLGAAVVAAVGLLGGFEPRVAALPANFQNQLLITGMNQPVDLVFLPDGRMLIAEKEGDIYIANPAVNPVTPVQYMTLNDIDTLGERGIESIVLDPSFGSNNFFYVYYHKASRGRARIARFTHTVDHAETSSEALIWEASHAPVDDIHLGGGLAFGPSGHLFLTTGDDGFAAKAQDLTTSYGKVIRVNKNGTIPADNPFNDGSGPNVDSIWAYGLRNPFRATWDAPTNRLLIAEVGGNNQSTASEDVHLGRAGANYGWPLCEGPSGNPSFPKCDPVLHDDPIFSYPHLGAGASISGGVVYRGTQFPSNFAGAYFYGDYVREFIRYLTFDSTGAVVTGDFAFEDNAGLVVSIKQAPDGTLYYVDVLGSVRRIRYTGTNRAPVITEAQATPTSGPAPLAVAFSGTATDADGDPLTYRWIFDDGDEALGPKVGHTYADNGPYLARLEVSDGQLTTLSNPIAITVGSPPTATITAPSDGALFRAGNVINFTGGGTDPDGTLTGANFTWRILFLHNEHTHPAFGPLTGTSGNFTIPTAGHGFADATGYRIVLIVTDNDGHSTVDSVDIFPDKVDVTFATNPSGLLVTLDGIARTAPFVHDSLIGFQHTIGAPSPQCVSGTQRVFASWSDGGAQTHTITVPASNATRTATFTDTGTPCGTPVITSTPKTAAAVGALYVYQVMGQDSEVPPSPLTYSLDVAPAGMSIGASSGLIQWTPTSSQLSTSPHAVRVRASNGSLATTQSYNVIVTAADAWWNNAWGERTILTLDMSGIGTSLPDFALLVVLDPSRISYAAVGPSGRDLRFIANDNATVLPHEIEQWTPGGISYVWVRVPWVSGGGAITRVWLYYDNPNANDAQNASALWAGHSAVWHLNGVADTSGQGNTGVNAGSVDTAGRIGRGRFFDGVNDRIEVPHSVELAFASNGSYTLSAWVNPQTLPSKWQGVVTKSRNATPWYGIWLAAGKWVAGAPNANVTGPSASTSTWAHVGIVQDGPAGQRRLYVNGVQVASGAAASAGGGGPLWIGGAAGTSEYFNGVLDEVRVHGSAMSAARLAATHRAESDNFIEFEGDTPPSNQPPEITSSPVTNATVGVAYSYQVAAADPDDGPSPLAYSLTTAPSGMAIGVSSGLIQWTPASVQAGSHSVTVRVTDGDLADTQPFTVTVGNTAPTWWNTAWTERRRLTLDMTGLATQTNFPLLVVLTPSRIDYTKTKANGADLRLIADDHTTVLPHEIEQWTAGGTSYVWVRVPSATGGGATTRIWVYYGNPSASDAQNATTVWTGHRAVWHLNGLTDASGQGHTGTNQGTLDAAGKIGRARRAGDARIQVPHAAGLSFSATDSFTLSAWANVETLRTRWQGVVTKSRDAAPWYGLWLSKSNTWVAGGPTNITDGPAAIGWTHLVVVQDGAAGQRRLYVNGALQGTALASAASGTGNLVIGGANGVSEDFFGVVDEVRLLGAAASNDRVAALFRSENDTLITYEGDTTPSNQPPEITSSPVTSATVGVAYSYQVVADDPDDGPSALAYSLTTAPSGMTIGASSGLIQWTPTSGQAGSHSVTVRVTDGDLPDTQTFTVTVGTTAPPWWNAAWTERRRLTLDTTGIATTQTNFPLLVVLTPSRIDYTRTKANGADVRLVADDHATVLPHEVEQWTAGGTSYLWVRVPTVNGGGATTRVWLYYGNANASDAQDAAALWNGHRAVWHLTGLTDASGQGHTGTNQGTLDAAGKIGRARRSGDARIQVTHAATLSFSATDSFTLSAWASVETLRARWQGVVTKSRDAAPWYGLWLSKSNAWVAGGPANITDGPAAIGWTHLAVVQDGAAGQRRLYVNGVLQGTVGAAAASGTGNLVIGGANGVAEDFYGVVDEVRLLGAAATADRIAALFRSEGDTLIAYESVP